MAFLGRDQRIEKRARAESNNFNRKRTVRLILRIGSLLNQSVSSFVPESMFEFFSSLL